jgi:hypothetical protein
MEGDAGERDGELEGEGDIAGCCGLGDTLAVVDVLGASGENTQSDLAKPTRRPVTSNTTSCPIIAFPPNTPPADPAS